MKRRSIVRCGIAMAIFKSLLLAGPAFAQGDSHVRMVVPLSVGSTVDTVARVLGPQLGEAVGRPIVVENRPGAGGMTGTQQIVHAPRDGSTIGIVSSNHAINPSIYPSIPFDSVEDITPIAMLGTVPLALVVHPSVPAHNVAELIALMKAQPGKLNLGSAGNGSTLHLAGVLFAKEAGVEISHVPYNGTGPLTSDLVGGQIEMAFISVTAVAPHIRSGKLRALGVSTPERVEILPEVPALAEAGLPRYSFDAWMALIGPAGLPTEVTRRYQAALQKALADPQAQETLRLQGVVTVAQPPEDLKAFFRTEVDKHAALVEQSGASIE